MAWNFSLASSLGLTSGCHCLAAFLYACVRRGGQGRHKPERVSERASRRARGSAADAARERAVRERAVRGALTFLMSLSSAFLVTPSLP